MISMSVKLMEKVNKEENYSAGAAENLIEEKGRKMLGRIVIKC